jgi:transglutaminase-like putative cysteine protease
MPFQKITMLAVLVLLCASSPFAAEIENSSSVQSVLARVLIEGQGNISGSLNGNEAKIEILSFTDTEWQRVISLEETLEIGGRRIAAEPMEDEFGNRYVLFRAKSTGAFTYKIDALIETNAELPKLRDYSLSEKIAQYPEFLEPSENIESNHETIRTMALNTFGGDSLLETIAGVTQWTYDNIEYDLGFYPETYSALSTLASKKGVCDEFAVVAAAMLRAKGIPTRVATGLTFNPKEGMGWNSHAWLQAFDPNTGWISLDPTFGEAGVVDGTHIQRGVFKDPANSSISRATAVQTAAISIYEKQANVEVRESQKFGKVFAIEAGKITMPASQWHELKTKFSNTTDGIVIGWAGLVLPADFVSQGNKRILLFQAGEEKELPWQIRIDKELKKNEYLSGHYRLMALGDELQESLKVVPGTGIDENANLELLSIVPIVKDGLLLLDISLENTGAENGNATISVEGQEQGLEVPGFGTATAKISVKGQENKAYAISIKGDGIDYETTITLQEGVPLPQQPQGQPQGQPAGQQTGDQLQGYLRQFFTLETGILAAIVIGIAAIVLLLKELLSK